MNDGMEDGIREAEYMQPHGGGKRAGQKHVESKTTSQLLSFDALSN